MDTEIPKVSVAIVTYNRLDKLRQCLDSVLNQSFKSMEIVLVDDGSTDGTDAAIAEYCEKHSLLRYFRREHTGTPTPHRNYCLEHSRGEIVFFIDDDCVAPKDWIENHMKFFNRPEVGAVGGPQIVPNPGLVDEYLFSIYVKNNTVYQEWTNPAEGQAPITANAAFRRDVALKCGGFDARVPTGEDVDLGLRILSAGHTIVNNPDNFVTHLKRMNYRGMLKMVFYRGSGSIAGYLTQGPRRKGFFSVHIEFSQFKSRWQRFAQVTKRKPGFFLRFRVHFLTASHYYAALAGRIYYYFKLRKRFMKRPE